MPSSVYWSILQAVQQVVGNLGLSTESNVLVPVNIRKLPKAEEKLDVPLPVIAVVPADKPPRREPLAFGVGSGGAIYQRIWPVEVVAISAGNRDFSQSGLSTYDTWHEAICSAFDTPTLENVPQVFDVNVEPDALLDREHLNEAYDYMGLLLEFTVAE